MKIRIVRIAGRTGVQALQAVNSIESHTLDGSRRHMGKAMSYQPNQGLGVDANLHVPSSHVFHSKIFQGSRTQLAHRPKSAATADLPPTSRDVRLVFGKICWKPLK